MPKYKNWIKSLEENSFHFYLGLPGDASGKEPTCQCRRHKRHWFDPWVGKIPWRRNGNPLQCSCLENPMERGAWRATVHVVTNSLGHDWSNLAQHHEYNAWERILNKLFSRNDSHDSWVETGAVRNQYPWTQLAMPFFNPRHFLKQMSNHHHFGFKSIPSKV